jgi:phosphoserine phosphatase
MRNYKTFSHSLWSQINAALEAELKANPRPVAVFDADGTLWDTDLGETFFKYQIEKALLPSLPSDPWRFYRDMKASGDPRPAYLWLAQINKGQKIETVQAWAQENVDRMRPLPIFESQKELIAKLIEKNVRVFIVTASVKWAVEPGAKVFGLGPADVLGVATKIENKIITDQPDGEITYKQGKIDALLKQTNGVKPFLASGNSPGDISLLKAATRLSLVVGASQPGHELYEAEESLRQEARLQNWPIHQF